eukprot:CAMPEP_0116870426 /NCGR_PEP_ID=MMETSP0463-20121206/317_1 /TAXON_ID=181622 /ORGANISM="Strombidinopsis sp, Strain SopsisLIS2011" /LENGTH=173 /DNA_ID=CAMNT_0004506917 /DNA_START=102 /DNA_END=623 /DNA_ORIENTATION=-
MEKSTHAKAFKVALKIGIPIEIRGEAWMYLIGNDQRIAQQLYDFLLNRVRFADKSVEKDQTFSKNLKVIENDLNRTFSELGYFKKGQKLYQSLKNILAAFSIFRPDLGYVQGMSYIAASILLHTGDELHAFRCLGNLMNKELLFSFYSFEMDKVNIIFNIFMKLMHDKLPKLY